MKLILLLVSSVFLFGCAERHEVVSTPLSEPSFYAGAIVPLSSNAYIDRSISKTEVEYLQKQLASERDGGDAKIDSIYKTKGADGDVIEVRRLYWFWRFKHTSDGQGLLVAHGDWFS